MKPKYEFQVSDEDLRQAGMGSSNLLAQMVRQSTQRYAVAINDVAREAFREAFQQWTYRLDRSPGELGHEDADDLMALFEAKLRQRFAAINMLADVEKPLAFTERLRGSLDE